MFKLLSIATSPVFCLDLSFLALDYADKQALREECINKDVEKKTENVLQFLVVPPWMKMPLFF